MLLKASKRSEFINPRTQNPNYLLITSSGYEYQKNVKKCVFLVQNIGNLIRIHILQAFDTEAGVYTSRADDFTQIILSMQRYPEKVSGARRIIGR